MRSQVVERTSAGPVPGVSKPVMRDLVSTRDLSPGEVRSVLDLAAVVKARPSDFRRTLEGKQLVMFFEKPSLRTRLTFEAGMASLGGTAFFMTRPAAALMRAKACMTSPTMWSAGWMRWYCGHSRIPQSRTWQRMRRSR